MRSAAVDKVGGYRTKFPYAEDIDLFLRLAARREQDGTIEYGMGFDEM